MSKYNVAEAARPTPAGDELTPEEIVRSIDRPTHEEAIEILEKVYSDTPRGHSHDFMDAAMEFEKKGIECSFECLFSL
jgi:hypothetical protein